MEVPDADRKEVRRPMNAFLIFCKRHRTMVREKNPHLDNRSVTRILGDLWANLQEEEKSQYTDLAKQYKDAFMKANPDYKWHNPDRLTHCQTGKPITRPSNIRLGRDESELPLEGSITPGKLADPSNMGGLSNLLVDKSAFIDGHKITKSAATAPSSVASLMDLAMMCSSELSDDQMMSDHHGNSDDPSNRVLDLTTKRKTSVDSEKVRNVDSSGDSSDAERGWNNNREHVSRDDKLPGSDGSNSQSSGQTMVDNIIDKLYTDNVQQSDIVSTGTRIAESSGLVSSPEMTALSGTRLKDPTKHLSGLPSFLTKRSDHDELMRGDGGFSGRKRCYSETSVDIYAESRKLPGILMGSNGTGETYDQSMEREFGEGDATEDALHPVRKSKRRNRGQRYQELINEGIIQPSKERMAVIKVETENSRNEQDSSEEEMAPRPLGDLGFDVLSVYPRQIRKRTCSESEKTRSLHEDMQRYKTGDFDLEAHIATLPACSLEKMSRNSKRPAGKVRSMSESCGRPSNVLEPASDSPTITSTSTPADVPEVVLTVPPHLKPNKQAEPVTGSQRRKARKHSVTHLQIVRPQPSIQEKTKYEETKVEKKTEASPPHAAPENSPSPPHTAPENSPNPPHTAPENSPTPKSNVDSTQDVIKSENTEIKVERENVSQRSEVKVREGISSPSGNSLSACNMIDNILVSLADQKEESSPDSGTNREDRQDNYRNDSLQDSSVTSQNIVKETGVISLTSEIIATKTNSSPPTTSIDVSSLLTKSDSSECEGFTNIKTADKGGQHSLCILPTEANNSVTPVKTLDSAATCITQTRGDSAATCITQTKGNNSSPFDNSSIDKTLPDTKVDNSDVSSVHASITMGTTSVPGGSYMSDVPCVTGQEYKVNPPQQVAVVNS
ncbi:uncharacterized protein LOC117341019 [Pecten maximus]|uniref:uncharacterized protein LOC117341019 n=1 Tax=Pecten maximus TaxID=6579 RepID=UPI00145840C3|nr:uncharacterized protein LOC117341019 [Pecten maximus]